MNKPVLRRVLTLLLLIVFVCASVFTVEAIANRRLLRLSGDARADIVLSLENASVTGGEESGDEEEDFEDEEESEDEEEDFEDEEESENEEEDFEGEEESEDEEEPAASGSSGSVDSVTLDSRDMAVAFDYTGYVNDLTLTGSAQHTAYTVTCTLRDGSLKTFSSIFAEYLNEDSVHIGCEVTGLSISTADENALVLTGVTVANSLLLNRSRMLLTALIAAALFLLIVYRRELGRQPAFAFLIVALAAGIYLSLALPVNTGYCYDDQIHAQNVIDLAYGSTPRPGGVIDFAESNWKLKDGDVFVDLQDTIRDGYAMEKMIASLPQETSASGSTLHWQYSYTGYLPAVAGMNTARLLGFGLPGQVRMARLFNMLAYVLLTFAGLCVMKRFRLLLAAIALTPGAMFLACNFSYDPFGTGCCFLGIALFMDALLDRGTLLSTPRAAMILISFLVGSMTKIVYIPLILLVLLLPKSKFAGKGAHITYKLGAILVCLGLLLSQVLMTTGDMTIIQDSRSEANSAEQLAWILANPLSYFGVFCKQLFGQFQTYVLDFWRLDLCYLPAVTGIPALLSLAVLLFCVFTDNPSSVPETRFDWKQRLYVFLLSGVVIGMVFTAMYIGMTPTGASYILGAQPRYLLPVLPLCYIVLSPDRIRCDIDESNRTLLFSLINLLILGSVAVTAVLSTFCL